jgi:hypothetical protein
LLVSVKGGRNIEPQFVRDLLGTVETQKAQIGVLITMADPTARRDRRSQVITVADLLTGRRRPQMPALMLPTYRRPRPPERSGAGEPLRRGRRRVSYGGISRSPGFGLFVIVAE